MALVNPPLALTLLKISKLTFCYFCQVFFLSARPVFVGFAFVHLWKSFAVANKLLQNALNMLSFVIRVGNMKGKISVIGFRSKANRRMSLARKTKANVVMSIYRCD